jgi:predicted O-methyltransferase YrrM
MMQFDDEFPKALLNFMDYEGMEYSQNRWFSFLDSAVLYSMVKLRNPKRVVEVGSGYSTKVIRQAHSGTIICIDPTPQADIEKYATLHIKSRVQDVPPDVFEDTDLLFIDSSHVWGAGDLPYLYDKAFPRLKPGSLVHSHDIFIPDDYPPGWKPRGYNEQYMLEAYLKKNENWAVLYPSYFMATRFPAEVIEVFGTAASTGSLWMVKCS